jgi:hypothetical protein
LWQRSYARAAHLLIVCAWRRAIQAFEHRLLSFWCARVVTERQQQHVEAWTVY